jgi:hypothetical protein
MFSFGLLNTWLHLTAFGVSSARSLFTPERAFFDSPDANPAYVFLGRGDVMDKTIRNKSPSGKISSVWDGIVMIRHTNRVKTIRNE